MACSTLSYGETHDSRWSLLPSGACFQVGLVLDCTREGPPDLKSVPLALARPFPPSHLSRHDPWRQCLNRTLSLVGEMPVYQSHLTNSLCTGYVRMRYPRTPPEPQPAFANSTPSKHWGCYVTLNFNFSSTLTFPPQSFNKNPNPKDGARTTAADSTVWAVCSQRLASSRYGIL